MYLVLPTLSTVLFLVGRVEGPSQPLFLAWRPFLLIAISEKGPVPILGFFGFCWDGLKRRKKGVVADDRSNTLLRDRRLEISPVGVVFFKVSAKIPATALHWQRPVFLPPPSLLLELAPLPTATHRPVLDFLFARCLGVTFQSVWVYPPKDFANCGDSVFLSPFKRTFLSAFPRTSVTRSCPHVFFDLGVPPT